MNWPLEGSREIDEGIIISEPMDWCKSPTAIVPYRLYAYQREAMSLADSVKLTSDRTHVKDSIVLKSYGDEPGVGGGVISGTHNAECTPKTWSLSVTAEGRNVVRHTDEWWMNHRNTFGRLYYLKDPNLYSTPETQEITRRMTPDTNLPEDASKFEALYQEPAPAGTTSPNDAAGGDTPAQKTPPPEPHPKNVQEFGTNFNKFNEYSYAVDYATHLLQGLRSSTKKRSERCPCIVGKFKDVQPQCSAANCGGNAHHIVADKYLRTGARGDESKRIKGMPSLDDGQAICLQGFKSEKDSDHSIAHDTDVIIEGDGEFNYKSYGTVKGTLPIWSVLQTSKFGAQNAAPDDCFNAIEKAADISNYGGKPNAVVRATNNPPAADSEAGKYFNPPASSPKE